MPYRGVAGDGEFALIWYGSQFGSIVTLLHFSVRLILLDIMGYYCMILWMYKLVKCYGLASWHWLHFGIKELKHHFFQTF